MQLSRFLLFQHSMEDRLDQMQAELERLECYAADGRSDYSRDLFRTSSPGELAKPRSRPTKVRQTDIVSHLRLSHDQWNAGIGRDGGSS